MSSTGFSFGASVLGSTSGICGSASLLYPDVSLLFTNSFIGTECASCFCISKEILSAPLTSITVTPSTFVSLALGSTLITSPFSFILSDFLVKPTASVPLPDVLSYQ